MKNVFDGNGNDGFCVAEYIGATERLVLSPTWLLLDFLGAGHVEHPWVRTFSPPLRGTVI